VIISIKHHEQVDTGDDVESEDDVQKLYMLLKPHWTRTGDRKPTLIILGRKKMPAVDNRARYWGFVVRANNIYYFCSRSIITDSLSNLGSSR
jgi:hypothetical protein